MLLRMVFSTRCSGCNPEGLSCSPVHSVSIRLSGIQTYTHYTRLHANPLGLQPLHLVLHTICSNIQPVLLKMDILDARNM